MTSSDVGKRMVGNIIIIVIIGIPIIGVIKEANRFSLIFLLGLVILFVQFYCNFYVLGVLMLRYF